MSEQVECSALTAAQILGVNPRTVARWADDGWLTVCRWTDGGHRRFLVAEVEELARELAKP